MIKPFSPMWWNFWWCLVKIKSLLESFLSKLCLFISFNFLCRLEVHNVHSAHSVVWILFTWVLLIVILFLLYISKLQWMQYTNWFEMCWTSNVSVFTLLLIKLLLWQAVTPTTQKGQVCRIWMHVCGCMCLQEILMVAPHKVFYSISFPSTACTSIL